MSIYFLILRIAALFGHKKAKKLVTGQAQAIGEIEAYKAQHKMKDVLWIHAASVGEFEQARPIIERLRAEQPQRTIVLTFFSPSGYELRKNYDKVDLVTYLPFATRKNAKRFVAALQPKIAIFVKYEWWPAYLRQLHKEAVELYSISAIFRPKQLFFWPWGKSYRQLLTFFKHIYVQDGESQRLLLQYGIDHVSVAGDTRFDRVNMIAANAKEIPAVGGFVRGCQRVIIAGSTWPKDEELLARYIDEHEDTKLVLAPHETDEKHLHTIFQLFLGRYVRLSQATRMNIEHGQTLVIDTVGMLSSIYQYGQVAYIGGGFGVGIHNTIEAAVYGMPVIFGPNYQHFREAKGLIQAGASVSVQDYKTLEAALDKAFNEREAMGASARAYVNSELGATEKIYSEIFADRNKWEEGTLF